MGSLAAPHVLVVDDEEAITYVFERYLSLSGYSVAVACSGREAVESFRAHPADLLITDFRMPGMNGIELIQALRALAPALPALVISANPIDAGVMPAGVRFFSKPVTMPDLLDRVAAMTARYNASAYAAGSAHSAPAASTPPGGREAGDGSRPIGASAGASANGLPK